VILPPLVFPGYTNPAAWISNRLGFAYFKLSHIFSPTYHTQSFCKVLVTGLVMATEANLRPKIDKFPTKS